MVQVLFEEKLRATIAAYEHFYVALRHCHEYHRGHRVTPLPETKEMFPKSILFWDGIAFMQ
jgi:hypothetical protein